MHSIPSQTVPSFEYVLRKSDEGCLTESALYMKLTCLLLICFFPVAISIVLDHVIIGISAYFRYIYSYL